jgi:DNA-binding GntR family transcriptional regulator
MASPPRPIHPDPNDIANFILEVQARESSHRLQEASLLASESEPLTRYVARVLRQQILDGELVPGQRIVQDVVANQLGTSRIPVREALRELASEGLVVIEPDVGARVRSLDPVELLEVYMMREALEPLAVLHAVPHLPEERLHELAVFLTKSEVCADAGDVAGYHQFDRLFHHALFEAAGLERLHGVIHGLWNTAYQYQRVYSRFPQNLTASTSEHRLILDAVERRASDDAGQLHLLHIRRTRHALVGHPEFFKGASPPPNENLGDVAPSQDDPKATRRKHRILKTPR